MRERRINPQVKETLGVEADATPFFKKLGTRLRIISKIYKRRFLRKSLGKNKW